MSAALLELSGIDKRFARRGPPVTALAGVDLAVAPGESLGVAGESGSGKSTLARIALRLEAPDAGRVAFRGEDITNRSGRGLADYRRQVQAVFQNSAGALAPRMRVRDIVAEPLVVQRRGLAEREIDARVEALLERVGLSAQLSACFPHELSGGQKQRVGIARALSVDPCLLLLDEPVSALDVSVRSQVLNLLLDLQAVRGLAYVLIAHDLAVLRHVTTRLLVMYRGRVVEQGRSEEVLAAPLHPYTRALVAASPRIGGPAGAGEPVREADGASPSGGCAFAPRCPLAFARCAEVVPALRGAAHQAACHAAEVTG